MAHKYDLNLYTYFDVKIVPEAAHHILTSTTTAAAVENGSLAGVEYLGHVGELDNHMLYRVPKQAPTNNPDSMNSHNANNEELENWRNKQIVDAITALQGVLHVDIQTLRQRTRRDEL
ncbi:hypothetical protein BGZ65_009855 [Modicella reniformis]|uniref:Uncharacterized protein n=1 Tax=Modicella reniformis TaxID=1440133 RepID=A0A9P6JKX1_9FUNG|nr:hypothetical protein BGZ65_009855 [Modicella reniformis]